VIEVTVWRSSMQPGQVELSQLLVRVTDVVVAPEQMPPL